MSTIVRLFVGLTASFCLIAGVLSGCSEEITAPTEEPPQEESLAEESVGPDGGILESEGFALQIPSGAFAATTSLELFEETTDPFRNQAGSRAYRVSGIPNNYGAPLQFRIRLHDGVTAPMAAIGEEVFVHSEGQTRVAWRLQQAADSAGWCSWELAPPEMFGGIHHGRVGMPRESLSPLRVMTVTDHESEPSTDSHFEIDYPEDRVTAAQVSELNGYLEEAYRTYYDMGFRNLDRTQWPVKVTIKELPLKTYGVWNASGWGPNFCGFEFNSLKMGDSEQLRLTAGHEVFHMFQYSYDPRSPWDRAKGGGLLYWLDEATAVWAETKFTEQAGYVSPVRSANELTPLAGLHAGASADPANHGYGLSSLIEYISRRQGEAFILQTYEGAKQGLHPVAALTQTLSEPIVSWWGSYLQELLGHGIYGDVTGNMARDERSGLINIAGPADTMGTFGADYSDLSGKVYLARLQYPEISEGASLELTTTGSALTSLAAFRYRNDSNLSLLDHGPGSLTIPNLRGLTEDGWWVVALVANHELDGPSYDGEFPVDLTWRVVDRLDLSVFDTAIVSIRYRADWGGGNIVERQGLNFSFEGGGFQGNTFVAEWDSIDTNDGTRFVGHIYATIDPDDQSLVDWDAENRWIYTTPETYNHYKAWGGRVALSDQDPNELEYYPSGTVSCDAITDINVTFRSEGEVTRDLAGYSCNGDSYVRIRIRDETP